MDAQDFEKYAEDKTFNYSVSNLWETVLSEVFSRLLKPLSDINILDYGCGDGKYFPHFRSKGFLPEQIHGVEISSLRIERCKRIGWKNAHLIQKGEKLPYSNATFDIVNFMEVIEHIPQNAIGQVLSEIRRVLKPGGFLVISTPNYPIKRFYDLVDAFVGHLWRRLRDDPTHVSFYNRKRLHAALDPLFNSVEERLYKPGFLYKRWPIPFFQHKLLFLCGTRDQS